MPFRNIPNYPVQPYYEYKGIGIGLPIDTMKYKLNIEPCRHSKDSLGLGVSVDSIKWKRVSEHIYGKCSTEYKYKGPKTILIIDTLK